MRYLVVLTELVEDGPPGEEVESANVYGVDLCADSRAVAASLRKADERGLDWAVFEATPQGAQRRAVVHRFDGRFLYDVEVQ